MSDTNTKEKVPKKVLLQHGNLTVSAYQFIIPDGEKKGTVLDLIQLETIKRVWSDEIKAMYEKKSYITLSAEAFNKLLQLGQPKA